MTIARLFTALAFMCLAACTAQPTPTFHAEGNPKLLSDWGQLVVTGGKLSSAKDVQHYRLRNALFSDYALKHRTVWMPKGTSATYHETEAFDFPVGTVITKTFYYEVPPGVDRLSGHVLKLTQKPMAIGSGVDLKYVRLIETRILAHREEGWVALPYVWNDAQTDATLKRTGDLINLTLVDRRSETPFPYIVPNTNQCAGCHATNNTTREIKPIGPKKRHLFLAVADPGDPHLKMQLLNWKNDKLLTGLPNKFGIWNERPGMNDWSHIEKKARDYLDINCSHCHSKTGPADTSGLHLTPDTPLGPHLGLCKTPIAAGRGTGDRAFGIVPGDADASILHYRMASNKADIMMPELGRSLVHEEGIKLIADWINDMDGSCEG